MKVQLHLSLLGNLLCTLPVFDTQENSVSSPILSSETTPKGIN